MTVCARVRMRVCAQYKACVCVCAVQRLCVRVWRIKRWKQRQDVEATITEAS